MRTLWAILGAVVLAAALFLLWPRAAPDAPRESSPPAPAPVAPPTPFTPPAPGTPLATTTPPAPAPPSATTAPPATPAPAPAPPATQPAVIERRPDGSLLVDHRFTLLGSGSQQDPYRVTWELLGSAAETRLEDLRLGLEVDEVGALAMDRPAFDRGGDLGAVVHRLTEDVEDAP